MQRRPDWEPGATTILRSAVERVFCSCKHWMGATHFLTRTLGRVSTEMTLQVLAYNLKRVMKILGVATGNEGDEDGRSLGFGGPFLRSKRHIITGFNY